MLSKNWSAVFRKRYVTSYSHRASPSRPSEMSASISAYSNGILVSNLVKANTVCQDLQSIDTTGIAEGRHTVFGRDIVCSSSGLEAGESSGSVVLTLLGHILSEISSIEVSLESL